MKKSAFIILCSIMFFAVACDKENDNENNTIQENSVLLLEYVYNVWGDGEKTLADKFEYDDQGRLSKHIWYYDEDVVAGTYEYKYNGLGEVASETFHSSYMSHTPTPFTKNGNIISSEGRRTIELNNQGLPIRYQFGEAELLITYTYDSKGNILSELRKEGYSGSEYQYSYDINYTEYDDKKAPFYSCNSPKWLPIVLGYHIVNNPIQSGTIYTYNKAGYIESDGSRLYTYIVKK